ncbi:hypothetical protein Tco_0892069 [Tanacetum coccineum]|uniref:Reverse transcriptase domain-containing protein n=1 Tax=Tanacetum coccineum TaxID=301880 RepID=A0ABQ5C6N9_9ASTR
MSSSTHPIIIPSYFDVEDAFSSTNTLDYTPASPDYFLTSSGNTSLDPLDDLSKYLLASLAISPFHDDLYMKVMQAYNATMLPLSPMFDPQDFFLHEEILPPQKRARFLSSSSDFSTPPQNGVPKWTLTSTAPAMIQATIKKLVADSVVAALEAQAATMVKAGDTNRNTQQGKTPVARKCSYKEFMSCQPFNFKGTEGAVGLIR